MTRRAETGSDFYQFSRMQTVPTSKVIQTVRIIREAIAKGEWPEFLPGERTLARDLMISRACLRRALEQLTHEGTLAPAERSKRRVIAKRPERESLVERKNVVFLTPEPAHRAAPLVLEQLAHLRHHLSKASMTVELVASTILRQSHSSSTSLSKLVAEHPGAR